jgi:hypothetical protein
VLAHRLIQCLDHLPQLAPLAALVGIAGRSQNELSEPQDGAPTVAIAGLLAFPAPAVQPFRDLPSAVRGPVEDRHPTAMRTWHRRRIRNCRMPDRDHQQPTSRA